MERHLIDTNIISDYFSGSFSEARLKFMDLIIDATPNLSVITQIELLSWKTDLNADQKSKRFHRRQQHFGNKP